MLDLNKTQSMANMTIVTPGFMMQKSCNVRKTQI